MTTDIYCYILFTVMLRRYKIERQRARYKLKRQGPHMRITGKNMNIIISNSSMEPIYEQIIGQIKSMIMSGKLKEGAMLPSVRTLSKDLKISALTVKKAYDSLEESGFIVTVHGKGSFVAAGNLNLLEEEKRKAVEASLELAVKEGRSCGMTDNEIRELLELIMED